MSQILQRATARPGRMQRRYQVAAVALLLTVAVVLGIALRPAAAAQLPLRPAKMTSVSVADRCTPTVAATNGTVTSAKATTVILTGLGTGCGGRPVALTLFGADGAALTTVAMNLPAGASGSATLTVPVYTPSAVSGAAVTVGTWGVPATWTYAPPAIHPLVTCKVINDPSKTCTASTNTTKWGGPPPGYYLQVIVGSGSVTKDVEWEITVNLDHPDLGVRATNIKASKNIVVAPGWGCSSMPLLVLRGTSGSQKVGGGERVWIDLDGSSSASPISGALITCF